MLGVGCRHVEHQVIQLLMVKWIVVLVAGLSGHLGVFIDHINVLVFVDWHVFLGEIVHCLTKANLVVQGRRPHQGGWLAVAL